MAIASLSGCAVYPAGPVYETYGAPAGPPYVVQQPGYIQGSTVYRHGNVPHPYPYGYYRGYNQAHPGMIQGHLPRPHPGRGMRDRDGDGVPNRFDRRPNRPDHR